MEIGEPEGDVVPVGGDSVASLVGVHRDVVQRVRPAQPVYGTGRVSVRGKQNAACSNKYHPPVRLQKLSPVFDQCGDLKGIGLVRIESPTCSVERI